MLEENFARSLEMTSINLTDLPWGFRVTSRAAYLTALVFAHRVASCAPEGQAQGVTSLRLHLVTPNSVSTSSGKRSPAKRPFAAML